MKVHQKKGFITCLKAGFSFQSVVSTTRKTRCFKVLSSTPCVCTICNESSTRFNFTVPQTLEYFRRSQTVQKVNLHYKVDKLRLPFFILLFFFFFFFLPSCRAHFVSPVTLIPTSKAFQSYICLLENLSTA